MTKNRPIYELPGESWLLPVVFVVPLGVIAAAAEFSGSAVVASMVIEAYIRVIAVVAIYIFVGNSGVMSYGHVAFMGIGAYASAWQTCCVSMKPIVMPGLPEFLQTADWPVVPSALSASLLATFVAFLAGLIIMRLENVAAAIATFALLFIFNSVYANWTNVTMGVSSMIGLPTYITPLYTWIWVAAAVVVAFFFQNSVWGIQLRATREEPTAALASGVHPIFLRVVAFTISGFFAGMAGVILGHYLGTLSVDTFFLDTTFLLLAMLIIGGMRSLSGAIVGALAVSLIEDTLSRLQVGFDIGGIEVGLPVGSVEIGIALTMLLILIFRRDGLMGGHELDLTWLQSLYRSAQANEHSSVTDR